MKKLSFLVLSIVMSLLSNAAITQANMSPSTNGSYVFTCYGEDGQISLQLLNMLLPRLNDRSHSEVMFMSVSVSGLKVSCAVSSFRVRSGIFSFAVPVKSKYVRHHILHDIAPQ